MMDFGRIVFVGNCQMGAMWRLYERILPRELAPSHAIFIESYNAAGDESRRAIAEAEKLAWQTTEFVQEIGEIQTGAPRCLMPMVICPFLWPNSGVPHPDNVSFPCLPGGPYPGEFGDEYLNRKIKAGADPKAAAEDYFALELGKEKRVTRMAQIALDQQRRRDAACGDYDVAGLIERLLPQEPLFRSRGHLNPPIMRHLAQILFAQLGATPEFMDYLATTRYDDLVPYSELPIHPSVGRELGLSYVSADTKYQFFGEGGYTFLEWAARYVRYDWNRDYNEAMHLARAGEMDRAIALWEKSMAVSLRSAVGRANLAEIMVRHGKIQGAVRWVREALALDPTNPDYARRAREIAAHAEWELANAPPGI